MNPKRVITPFLLWSIMLWIAASPAFPLEIETLKKGVGRVKATVDGKAMVGTGVVVRRDASAAYIVTAAHVIEGAQEVEVEFYTQRNHFLRAKVIAIDAGGPDGLAVLMVEKETPSDVLVLQMNQEVPVRAGDPVTMIGFPQIVGAPWAVTKGEIVGRKAKAIVFSGAVDGGSSGGPLMKDNQIVGIVTEAGAKFAYAVPSMIARYALEGWGVKFGVQLRIKPAMLTKSVVRLMIKERGFNHHPNENRFDVSGDNFTGNFEHEYEARILEGVKVVLDRATGLMWEQSGSSTTVSLDEAQKHLDQLNKKGYAGFTDWRLPTIEELASLLEPIGIKRLFIDPLFDTTQKVCVSADHFFDPKMYDSSLVVDFIQGALLPVMTARNYDRGDHFFVRAVRSLSATDGMSNNLTAPSMDKLQSK